MFNFKKFAQVKPSSQPASAGSSEILNEINQSPTSGNEADQQADKKIQEYKKEYNISLMNYEKEKETFEQLKNALAEIQKDSPFAKVVPVNLSQACEKTTEIMNNFSTPEEIADIYKQYIDLFQKLPALFQNVQNQSEMLISKVNADPQAGPRFRETEQASKIEIELNKIIQEINFMKLQNIKQQRQFNQFNVLYQDMFNFYSVMSKICQTQTRYNKDVENFKFGDPEDWQALLSSYEYLISLLQIMAPKAAKVIPQQAELVQNKYQSLIEETQGEINKLSRQPLLNLYGGGK